MIRYKTYTSAEDTAPTNNGGFLGGLGYVGQKIGAGFMQTFEGVWDYAAGGIADIFGADEWAKRQMDEDWFGTWYSDIDKNFNPGKGWKIAGDVAGGIGNVGAGAAAAALAVGSALAITAATGGAGLPVAASTIATTAGALTAGFGAAGNATKEAYRETGELTGKEYGYGALSGATEAGLELVTAGIGKGSGKLLKSVGKAVAGEASEEAAKVGAKAIIKEVAKDFASEAFEEGASEYLAPKYKRMTYDPNAQDATREEIAYAAFIGGLTGAVMNGATGSVTLTSDAVSGKKAKASGQAELIEKLGKQISEEEAKSPSGYELLANIKKIYDRGGDSAVRVGQLKRMEAAARLLPAVEKSAMAIVSAPQYAVERFARMGVTEINGKALSAEMLTEAIDLDHGNKTALKTLRQAISKNPILATLAMADATAKLQLDSTKYTEGIASKGALGTSGDWNTFLATASAEEKAAVGKMFGVENIDALEYGTARAYAMMYAESDEGKATVRRAVQAKDAVEAIAENDKPLPKVIVTTDGARRYGEVGIIKEGGEVRFYDYTTGRMTQPMTVREANAKLAQDRAAALSETAKAQENKTETKTEAKKPTADEEIHTWAMENIKKYNELTGRERQEVRATIRQARALGISEADTITYATVAARSGVRIVFSKERCLRHVTVEEDGKLVEKVGFSDGFYNHNTNEIVVNPEGKRSPTKLLLHELAHALYANKGFARLLDRAAKRMDDDRKKEITDRYTEAGQEKFIPEEHAVHHAEDVIGNDATLERLLRDEPTMGDKILSFFGLAKTDYQGHERLSRAAGRLYNRYKATFDRFATANRGTVRIEGIGDSKGIRDAFAGELSEKADKGMLAKAKAMLEGGADSEKVRQETGWFQGYDGKWRYEIDDSTAVWHLDTAKPDPKRLVHFGERIFKLTDLLDHPAMYEAYPQLKDVTVWENPDAPVDGYVVGKNTDHITVRSLSSVGNLSKDIVIHEVQHLIQNIEGFTSGASKDQFEYKSWGPKEWDAYEKRNEIAGKLYAVLRRHGEHITAKDVSAMRQEFAETDSILDRNFFLLSTLADNNKRVDYLRDEYYKQVHILQLTTPSGQYHAVAGEIEAYDAQARRRMTAEERKNTRPNIDREDAIVLGDTGIELEKHFDEYPYNMQTVIQEYMDSTDPEIEKMVSLLQETGELPFERHRIIDMSEKMVKDLKEVTGVDYSGYSHWINSNAIRHIEARHGINGEADTSMANPKDVARIAYILSQYDSVELLRNENGDVVYSEEFRDSKNQPMPLLLYRKRINGTYYFVEAVGENAYKKIWATSAYISKKELTHVSASDTIGRQLTSKTLHASRSFDSSVAQSSEDVKTQGENNSTESTLAIRHAEDGAVAKSTVTETVISTFKGGVRDSITTEFVALPKQEMSVTTGEGQIMHTIDGIEATPVKGIGGQTIEGFTGRDVREWAMKGNGFTAVQIENVDRFMDEMGKFMKKAGVTYRFIGLADVENAKLHYTYDAQGKIKSIVLSAMVKNGDYPVNFDLSSICKKRVAMSTLIDKFANRGTLDNGTVALTPAQIFAINTALKNAGYETACLGCFVESKRYNAMAWAKSFVDKWNKAVKAVNPNATYFGYGDGTNTTEVTVAQANRIDVATKEYIANTKTKRMEQALAKYKEKAAKGLPLISGKKQMIDGKEIETFTKAARDRIVRSETISDALKERYLNADVSTLGMEDVKFLLENGVLPGASISNKQAVTELVKSGEAYQHLLRPSDLLTAKGIAKLEELPNFHGVLYGHYGSGTPKLMQSFTPYNSEIALLPSKKGDTGLAEYLYSIAGVRMQSFSDFQVQNIYDYLQMVADLAARKLPAHAYTKEISFAKLLGMTGIKVNLSVMFDIDPTVDAAHAGLTRRIPFIHKGEYAKVVLHDEQGDWVYNVGDYQTQRAFAEADPDADLRFLQSIGFADAVKLQTTEGYSSNCGIIGVGYSDLHILAMLDDNRIRYIIPYHASSLPAEIKVATNIALGTDYTPYQNTMKIDSIVDKNGKKVEWSVKEAYRRLGSGKAVLAELNAKIKSDGWEVKTKKAQNGHGTYGLYEDLGKTSDPRKTAENFMDWCVGNGSLPLFYQFASHANYYKLLYDYNVYDCVSEQYAPQTAVTNTYPAGDAAKPTNAADTRLDTTYLTGVIDKQMSFMDRYGQNLDRDLDAIASKVERGDMSGSRDALPEDLDTFDPSEYNEIKLNGIEADRLQSEALTWDARHRNEIRTRTLANGIQYRYYIDDESIVHCIGRKTSQNIHERRKEYDLRDREKLDSVTESLRYGQGDDRGVRGAVRNGRKPTDGDRLDHRVLRQARDDKRTDDTANGAVSDGNAQGREQAGASTEIARALAFKERLLSKGYYEENGYIYAPDGTKTTFFFPEVERRDALPSDAEYMTAVNSGDMEKVQRMVDAAAKAAGYDSPKLYHGTGKFGFTEFDPTMSDDKISFFVSSNKNVSETYSGGGTVRPISSRADITPDGLDNASPETILKLLRENVDKAYERISEEEHRNIVEKYRSDIDYAIHIASHIGDAVGASDKAKALLATWVSHLEAMKEATTYKAFMDAYEAFESSKWDLWRENSRLFDGVNGVTYQEIGSAYRGLTNVLDMTLYRKSGEEEYINQNEAITELNKYMFRGVYELYAKVGKQLKVDANGQNWNQIDGKNIGTEGPVRTRDVAKYAHDNGYDSALIKNVYDNGDYTFGGQGDVYIFFGSNRLKSADPITYDDDGKVIPLSKRFDMENPDIRYALPEDATYVSPTAGAVGKTKAEYKAGFKDKVFTASTRTYIDTVDELYGIETYLRKVGKMDKAAVEALVQQARAARSQAQTMIGTAQYNVFSDKVERMGDGLLEILKPTQNWTAKKKGAFDDYLLNQLNIDRMTLESRTTMWAAPVRARLAKQQSDLANLKKQLSSMERKVEDLATEIGNARGYRDTAKLSKTREKWRTRIAELENRKSAAEALISQYEKDIKAASRAVDKTKAELDAMIVKDKPVFGKDETLDEHGNVKRDHDITADESRDIVKKYEAAYPEFAEMAKRLYAYLDNVQKLRVEAGLITQDMADHMKKLYPHYVPSYRDVEGGGISSIKGKNAMEVSKTVRKAQGGNQDILDVSVSIAMQTDEVLKAGQINKLARALYDAAKSSGDDAYVKIVSEEVVGAQEDAVDAVMRPKPGQLTFYADGKRVTMEISKELLYGFDGLRKPSVDFESPVIAALATLNNLYKRGVTSLNPAFAIRNPIRDFQDAGLNSKHPLLFAKQMAGLAQKGIATNSERWELYRAMGGFSSTVFDGALHKQAGYAGFESIAELFSAVEGETDLKAAWRKLSAPAKALFRSVENANAFLEQTTRFAEFCASLDAGDSPAVALNNSAEVTTNFGRRGRITKVLNATVMPFLNPAVQGFDKLFRNVGDAFTGGHWVRGMATLITKAAIIGIAPMLLNSLMYDDDEEYKKLRETDKENNFLIKTADGTFIKIPRGRLASVIGGLYNRGDKLAKGEDAELAGYASNVVSQITPVENVSRTIFSPLFDVKNNKTWYGSEIEGREWDDTAPRDRYDESTSSIAVAIGQAINYSPKKVHYLLDQYSGVIGDFALPATSKKEKRDFFSGNFTLDSVTSNKLSERFYDAYDKTAYADTAGDEAATYRLKYLNDVKKAVRDMNKELDEIRNSDLSNTEKLQKTRVVRSLINAAYDSALKSLDAVNAAIEETAGIEDEVLREAEVNRRVFGAEYALKQYNEKTYEKYVLMHGGGIGYDELYAYHFATLGIESDLDKRGNVIEGSKKKKILAVINALDIPKEQKLILLYSRGYTAKDGDIKGVSAARAKTILAGYIAKAKGMTKAQREELAKACGLKVTNGRISVK